MLHKGQNNNRPPSETLQRALDIESCPHLTDCSISVTKDYFGRICISKGFKKCHHFARRVGELKEPISWLQKFAIDQDKRMKAENKSEK